MNKKHSIPPTIYRYTIFEILKPFLFLLFLLFFIILIYSSYDYLQKAATGVISKTVLVPIIFFKNIVSLEVLIPLSFFLACTLVLSRMDDNGEIIALLSSGFDTSRIFKPVLLLTIILAIIAGLLSFFIRPWSYQNVYMLEYHTKHTFDIAKINPGHFVSLDEDKRIIYTMDKTDDGLLKDVFIQTKNEDTFEITYAKSAKINDNGSNRVLVLKEGTIYVYDLKTKKEAFSKFGTSYVNITTTASLDYKAKSQPTYKLMQNLTRENMVELQWRITVPIMTVFFGLLATVLSRSSPRVKRRAQKLILAILIYAVYYNFYQVFKKWVLNGYFPLIPGTFFLTALLFVIYIYIKLINKKEYLY